MNEPEEYDTLLGTGVCEEIPAEDSMDATVGAGSDENTVEKYTGDYADKKNNYELYKKMTSLGKTQMYEFSELESYDTIRSIVQMKFLDIPLFVFSLFVLFLSPLFQQGLYHPLRI